MWSKDDAYGKWCIAEVIYVRIESKKPEQTYE